MTDQYLANYRGQINGLVAHETQAAFVSSHAEGQPTALYRLDLAHEKIQINAEPLPCGASALVSDGKTLWLAGQDGKIYTSPLAKGKAKALAKPDFSDVKVSGLALLAGKRLAVLQPKQLHIIDSKTGKILQSFSSPEYLTALASTADGTHLAVGDAKGEIRVYQSGENGGNKAGESKGHEYTLSTSGKVHQGKVIAIQFEANELRFYSSGTDKKLFSTHAQGKLQPLDKGRSSNHDSNINAIHLGTERFYTGSSDRTIKSWAYSGGQPVTFKENGAKFTALTSITHRDKPCLLAAATDSSLRVIALSEDEKFTELKIILNDGYQQAQQLLNDNDPACREQGIDQLADYDDKKALELIAGHFNNEKDKVIRDHTVTRLSQAQHPYSTEILEQLLKDKRNDSVRSQAFAGLIKRANPGDLNPYEKALASGFLDIGGEALELLAKSAKKDPRATQLMVQALQHKQARLRLLALSLLEKIYDKTSPKASLQGLQSEYADLQRAALIRLFQRKLLDDIDVKRAVLLAQAHDDAQLRHTAFLVSVLSQKPLTQALKTREPDLARQLQEIEDFELLAAANPAIDTNAPTAQQNTQTPHQTTAQKGRINTLVDTLKQVADKVTNKPGQTAATKTPRPYPLSKLTHNDFTVLLQGMANAHADICFMSAFALAILEDQRAFGLLLLLSQEQDKTIRAGVCRAFGWLKQTESIQSLELMLNDGEALVRDAAFTALHSLQPEPLLTAECGLQSQHEDIHARGLKVLLDTFAGKLSKAAQQQALALITDALNDPFPAIRQETFKAVLNRQSSQQGAASRGKNKSEDKKASDKQAGDKTATLELLMTSRFENVHQEILNEVMAAGKKLPIADWVEPLLLRLFNDEFSAIREAAFRFAITGKKHFDGQSVLSAAVSSQFVDVRQAAFKHIKSKPTQANQTHLEKLISDEDKGLRNQALSALVQSIKTGKNTDALNSALHSDYDDIRVNAACALANWGDEQAYDVLADLLNRDVPQKKHEQQHWQSIAQQALQGLAALGDSRAFPLVLRCIAADEKTFIALSDSGISDSGINHNGPADAALPATSNPFIKTNDKTLLKQAAQTLPWVVNETHIPVLRTLQAGENVSIRMQAGFALALLGQPGAHAEQALTDPVSIHHQLAATLCAAEVNPVSLQSFFLNGQTLISALIVLASHELLLHGDEPVLSTHALSIAKPEVQIFCADLIVRFSDKEACWAYLRGWLVQPYREQDDEKWDISIDALQQIAAVLVYGNGHSKAHLLSVLALIDKHAPRKTWELHFQAFTRRYAKQIATAQKQVAPETDIKPLQSAWNQRAFGAYLGVVRQEPADYYERYQVLGQRLKSLRSMDALAKQDEGLQPTVESCFLTLLNHNQTEIRQLAFDKLKASNIDPALLGNTATTSPQSDMATQGLALLTQHYPVKQSRKLLESLIRGDNEVLSLAAYQLHRDDGGLVKTAEFALESNTFWLRRFCVDELAAQFDDSKVQHLLVSATDNPDPDAAITAAQHLAQHQHPEAFAALKKLLDHQTERHQQAVIINGLRQLPDVSVAEYLLDYLNNNPLNRQPADRLYRWIAAYRHPGVFEGLLQRLETQPKEAGDIIRTLKTISGYDQRIEDYEAEQADRSWLEKQHPRHAALLIQLFTTLIKLDRHEAAMKLDQAMGWMINKAADQALLDAVPVIAEKQLAQLIEIIVYRAERREGHIAGLLQVLEHKDSTVQFLAAEGLANNGHDQGFNVLFAAMDYQENLEFRQRAVLALGKLADQRALDKLLKLAEDKEHALNEAAIEAIGFMGESEHHDKIFKLLKTALAKADYYSDMTGHALNGLRWFNTLEAWQLILKFIENTDNSWSDRQTAVELLEHHDTETSRDLLLKVLRTEHDNDVVESAYFTARKLWQADTGTTDKPSTQTSAPNESCNEVDYALLQGYHPDTDENVLERVTRYAPTTQLLTLLATDFPDEDEAVDIIQQLGNSLLNRDDISAGDLNSGLASNNPAVISIIARLLARMNKISKTVQDNLQTATQRYFQLWQDNYHELLKNNDWALRERCQQNEQVLLELLWSSTQHGVFSTHWLKLLNTHQKPQRVFQIHILTALLTLEKLSDKTVLSSLQQLADSPVLQVSTLANQLLAKFGSNKDQPLSWEHFLAQPQHLLDKQFTASLQQAAAQSAHQAQALPVLIRKQDVSTLSAIANDAQQQESLRIGAIEGLACMLNEAARKALQQINQDSNDKDIAKTAWRALRRQQRNQQKQDALKNMDKQHTVVAGAQ